MPIVTCPCRYEFHVAPCRVRAGRIYCSPECATKYRNHRKPNPLCSRLTVPLTKHTRADLEKRARLEGLSPTDLARRAIELILE